MKRGKQLLAGYEAWSKSVEMPPPFPGVRFYMLHSLAHLLISAISLECGYAASALRERIYCGPSAKDPTAMAAILLSTGTSGTEGTLGGLVEQGRQIRAHLQRAWDLGRLAFDRAAILAPLHRAMKERGVSTTIFVDIEGETANPADADAFAGAFIDKWFRKVWTFGLPKPDIYYDPRTAIRGDTPGYEWATLHAKCIVVDDTRALITSANFTDRAQTRNIEAGVLIEDKGFSEELAGHWRQLVSEGLVRRYVG